MKELITSREGDPNIERLFLHEYPFRKITYAIIDPLAQNRPSYILFTLSASVDAHSKNFSPFMNIHYTQGEADSPTVGSSNDALALQIKNLVRQGKTPKAITLAISGGVLDKNFLTNLIIQTLHPELEKRKIKRTEQGLIREWKRIKRLVFETFQTLCLSSPPISGPNQENMARVEWQDRLNIRVYYKGRFQQYLSVRNKILRCGLSTNPATYINDSIGEWLSKQGLKYQHYFGKNFDNFSKKENLSRCYLHLKRLYIDKTKTNPIEYIANNIDEKMTFFNIKWPGHRDLKMALNKAQDSLKSLGRNFILDKDTAAFVPRTYNDDLYSLSNHALGRAIDINHNKNPHVRNKEIIMVIDSVCKPVLPNGLLAEKTFGPLKKASDFFKNNFNDQWISLQVNNEKLFKAIRNNRNRSELNRYARDGFLNLDPLLVEHLLKANLGWGGQWRETKDFMHFELASP